MDYYGIGCEFKNNVLKGCLDELSQQNRKIVLLYYWWGYRDAEIGELLDESQQTINYRRHRVLKQIKNSLLKRT